MRQEINFGDFSKEYASLDRAKIVIIPVTYDATSTWIKGADKGPAAIIEASAHMELYDIETDSEVYKKGIFMAKPVREQELPESMVTTVETQVRHYLKEDKFVVVVGGEHSVSIGAAKAHVENNSDITVLQLDAHSDLRDYYEGSKYNHACVMARVKEFCPIVQVGVRSMSVSEKESADESRIFLAEDIHDNTDWFKKVIAKLSHDVYITVDLDALDPSIMPSTGTPEPGGLLWYDLLALLRMVSEKKNVVGFDVVELCPDSSNRAPDFLAAKLIYKLLSYKFGG